MIHHSSFWFRHFSPPYRTQIEIKHRSGEEEAIGEVENAADAGELVAAVFDGDAALEDGLGEISSDGGGAENGGEDHAVKPAERGELIRNPGEHKGGGTEGAEEGAKEAFPGFRRADMRDHFVLPETHANEISAHVAEFRHHDEKEHEKATLHRLARVEVDELHHEAEEDDGIDDAKDGIEDALEREHALKLVAVAEEEAAMPEAPQAALADLAEETDALVKAASTLLAAEAAKSAGEEEEAAEPADGLVEASEPPQAALADLAEATDGLVEAPAAPCSAEAAKPAEEEEAAAEPAVELVEALEPAAAEEVEAAEPAAEAAEPAAEAAEPAAEPLLVLALDQVLVFFKIFF